MGARLRYRSTQAIARCQVKIATRRMLQPTLASGIPDLKLNDSIGKLHSLGDESGCSMARSAHALRQDEWIHTANSALLELQELVTHETSNQARLSHSHMPKEYKLWGTEISHVSPQPGRQLGKRRRQGTHPGASTLQ